MPDAIKCVNYPARLCPIAGGCIEKCIRQKGTKANKARQIKRRTRKAKR